MAVIHLSTLSGLGAIAHQVLHITHRPIRSPPTIGDACKYPAALGLDQLLNGASAPANVGGAARRARPAQTPKKLGLPGFTSVRTTLRKSRTPALAMPRARHDWPKGMLCPIET